MTEQDQQETLPTTPDDAAYVEPEQLFMDSTKPVEMTPPDPPVVTHAELPLEAPGAPAPDAFVEMPEGYETLPSIDWVNVTEAKSDKYSWRTGGNGMFRAVVRWPQYIEQWPVEARPDFEAIRKSIIERRVWVGAEEHVSDAGPWIPVVAGSRAYRFGAQGWGDLMAAIWSTELDTDLSPVDFYHWRTATPPDAWGSLSERSRTNPGPQEYEEGHELKEPGEDAPLHGHGESRHHAGLLENSTTARETVNADEATTEARAELNAEEKAEPGEALEEEHEAESTEGEEKPKKKKRKPLW